MTEQEKQQRVSELLSELRELRATPRSDWHAGFEALLRIETHRFENLVHIRTEEEIGEVPPRTDFVILVEDEKVDFGKEIFSIFKGINILEYKNPHDSLNERVLRKVCGYANLYIGMAEHEGDRPSEQVTISIFRAEKNEKLFKKMENDGSLIPDATAGIYHVVGFTDLPFQIIITSELKGDEYAAYRALTDKAEEADVRHLIGDISVEHDDMMREHYRVLLNLVIQKNPQYTDIGKGDVTMEDVLMEMVKDRVDEKVNTAVTAKEQETKSRDIRNVMDTFGVSIEKAMDSLMVPADQRSSYRTLVMQLKPQTGAVTAQI
ncbi:MAG: hypothetical protein IJ708_10575 [Clostridia bacterium]|nr:hypothetical protein [Clostridia bacterium]